MVSIFPFDDSPDTVLLYLYNSSCMMYIVCIVDKLTDILLQNVVAALTVTNEDKCRSAAIRLR